MVQGKSCSCAQTPNGKEEEEGSRIFPVVPSDERQWAHIKTPGFGIIFMGFLVAVGFFLTVKVVKPWNRLPKEVMESPGLHPWRYSKPDRTQSWTTLQGCYPLGEILAIKTKHLPGMAWESTADFPSLPLPAADFKTDQCHQQSTAA